MFTPLTVFLLVSVVMPLAQSPAHKVAPQPAPKGTQAAVGAQPATYKYRSGSFHPTRWLVTYRGLVPEVFARELNANRTNPDSKLEGQIRGELERLNDSSEGLSAKRSAASALDAFFKRKSEEEAPDGTRVTNHYGLPVTRNLPVVHVVEFNGGSPPATQETMLAQWIGGADAPKYSLGKWTSDPPLYYERVSYVTPLAAQSPPAEYPEPEDERFDKQKEMFEYLNLPQAWSEFQICAWSTEGVNVALLDSGVFTKHPDLKGSFADCEPLDDINGELFRNLNEVQADPPYCGINLVGHGKSLDDQDGHGTSVAGILAAQHNKRGVASAGCNVSLIPVRMLSEATPTNTEDVYGSLVYVDARYSDDFRIPVMNCSWRNQAGEEDLQIEKEGFRDVAHGQILAVCAAGNDGDDLERSPVYPASFAKDLPNVISVTASNNDGSRPPLANVGANSVWIAAPGTDVETTSVYPLYDAVDGSSIAAGIVSVAASFVMSERKELMPEVVQRILCKSVHEDPKGIWSNIKCHGVIDFGKLLELTYNPPAADGIAPKPIQPLQPKTKVLCRGTAKKCSSKTISQ